MQYTNPITRQPIIIGLLLSIAIHVAMLSSRSLYTPPVPRMATGRTVVQLTLLPSRSSPAHASEPVKTAAPATPTSRPAPQTAPSPLEKAVLETAAAEATNQDATLEQEKGVIRDAVAASAFHPTYPRISKRRGEEGTVILTIQVRADGSVGQVDLLQSSGFRRLDEAAVKGALQTTFTPAERLGRPVESVTRLSYTFRLTND
ncbi:MAG TPA: TonB family protein [Pontiella sp.]|nr:TonB family protein [Pontiella sp.]